MSVLILGVGSAVPTAKRNPSAQLIETEGHYYLIDCGEGTQIQLRRNKVKLQRIHQIFITHLHGDHYLGLMGLIWTMSLLGRTASLTVYGPPRLKEIVDLHLSVVSGKLNFDLHFGASEVGAGNVVHEDDKVTVTAIELKHKIKCTGFLFREKPKLRKLLTDKIEEYEIPYSRRKGIKQGMDFYDTRHEKWVRNDELTEPPLPVTSYAYCSDTAFHKDTIAQVSGVDVLYHEATFMEADRERTVTTKHSTAAQAATVAREAKARKLILGHYSNRYKNLQPLLEEALQVFPHTLLGEEGHHYDLG